MPIITYFSSISLLLLLLLVVVVYLFLLLLLYTYLFVCGLHCGACASCNAHIKIDLPFSLSLPNFLSPPVLPTLGFCMSARYLDLGLHAYSAGTCSVSPSLKRYFLTYSGSLPHLEKPVFSEFSADRSIWKAPFPPGSLWEATAVFLERYRPSQPLLSEPQGTARHLARGLGFFLQVPPVRTKSPFQANCKSLTW